MPRAKKVEDTEETVQETAPETQETPPQAPASLPIEAHVPAGSKAEQMRRQLASEPKVRIMVPLASGEKPGVTQSVVLNGYSMYIRKGDYVDVPKSVAEVLEIKMKHKMEVQNHPLNVSRGEVKMEAYGS